MIPSQPQDDAFAIFRRMYLTESHRALVMRFIHDSFEQAAKQFNSLRILLYCVGVSCLVRVCASSDGLSSAAESFAVDLLGKWLPAAGAGLAAVRIVLIQIRRRKLVNTMMAQGFPPFYAAWMPRLAMLIDAYILTQPMMRLLRKFRGRR